MAVKSSKIYQFKVTLIRSKPSIWRRIQVPENYNFWQLHVAIQDAMGWYDCHLHEFNIDDPSTGFEVAIGMSEDIEYDEDIISEQKAKIKKYFTASNKKSLYKYDFGDGWQHNILLEKILPATKAEDYPICIAGKRKCPPEDCGGIWGYKDLLTVMNDPDDPEYEEKMEWLGEGFDPEEFHPKSVIFTHRKQGDL